MSWLVELMLSEPVEKQRHPCLLSKQGHSHQAISPTLMSPIWLQRSEAVLSLSRWTYPLLPLPPLSLEWSTWGTRSDLKTSDPSSAYLVA